MMINLYSNSTASSSSIASIGSRIRVNYKLVIVTALNPNSFSVAFRFMASHIVGYPRMGPKRELKFALESFWDGKSTAEDLQKVAADLRSSIWKQMSDAGIKYISSNTFSYYDQVLDTTAMLGAVPARYN
ncbi:putative cobalamin-independent methionine synthase MetE, UROD/MetE-like superfamily [Helianthus annuus]|uniref:Cobalamin-independent methionine synthase MetE, UROD/MetE-like superfamily n=1 Tax=Helianthus annuus TaxID=4232 RepID=A0A251T9G3_HELAN|nr:putative cobalamin-independent methionine synthase MetE, UROD/MetE-like superfamily [Helianthus annuus]KAJ0462897.1 putative cobalamin-independent methionine synthase MetE, UROD/MetE-like superfamily [Helianthus annuus]KAJ0507799.1 putative cobalamin-independent methionine synthase MetE, UROD/MetE-like superfamily [Helianthus annuus]KAJ0516210.1 putative cobalamin-independent methionine synthase MetE, UROD/MetE-like superfamily [Helianthus annuus]